MRQILFLLTLALAAPSIAVAGPKVPNKEQLSVQKAELKETKKTHRQLDRYARKWEKGVDKDKTKKIAKFDGKLADIYDSELARLRDRGVPTKVAEAPPPKPQHPAHAEKVRPQPPAEPEHPKLENLRDDLVALRDAGRQRSDGTGRVKVSERKHLSQVQKAVEKRHERLDQRYYEAKQRAKG